MDQKLYLSSPPHIRAEQSTEQIMRAVIYALLPACAVAVYFFGLPALRVLVLCTLACVLIEVLCQKLMGRPLTWRDGSAALTGILLALNLPPSSPWWLVLIGAVVAIAVAKQIFGGLGHNPFNPALVARVVLLISFPVQMTTWSAPSPWGSDFHTLTTATPLGEMQSAVMLTGELPAALQQNTLNYLLGNMGGSLGEVSALALLLGAGFLFWKRVITWHIPVSFLASVVVLAGFFWLLDPSRYPSPLFHLLTGGLMLGVFFMATDMVTSPVTPLGMVIFGVGCGLLTVLIRLFGGYPEGVSFAILLMNAATPLIDRYTRPRVFGTVTAKAKA
ncbi:RnfABCDGE type electron transport complex subunit D [Geoalkalibacter halelectricus]|uniref:Ion-translocating oxidoreductase complex subunit D n=1 Tax=Geoalkalibacter halelectricus TaxID=2847045 RepID=A0ABY5ZHS2_9BACT|nr:RnfABCDGE type electron transport complex subunit D [Geoalkalibacter halelectricus]MDO3378153.1 RnfABCDGE type electron transport complex subunit D [Geoalkalibacter halelectricus]UWZ77999.1 RnfABCDGE type electron transport complex subunit D [Geoalkalibacter halelectricus]